jgi:hypothetical protein
VTSYRARVLDGAGVELTTGPGVAFEVGGGLEPTRDPLCVGLMPICTGPSTQWVHAVRLGPGFVTAQWGGMTGQINVEIVDGGCG